MLSVPGELQKAVPLPCQGPSVLRAQEGPGATWRGLSFVGTLFQLPVGQNQERFCAAESQLEGHIGLGGSPGLDVEDLEHQLTNLAHHPEVTNANSKFSEGHGNKTNKGFE